MQKQKSIDAIEVAAKKAGALINKKQIRKVAFIGIGDVDSPDLLMRGTAAECAKNTAVLVVSELAVTTSDSETVKWMDAAAYLKSEDVPQALELLWCGDTASSKTAWELVERAQAAIVLAKQNVTAKKQLQQIKSDLSNLDIEILGIIWNGML